MKKIAIILSLLATMYISCGDKPPDILIPDDLLEQILTDGEWSVTDYKINGTDRTPEFYGWRFKFHTSKVVDAKFNTNIMSSGNWDGDQSTMKFSASFTNPSPPVTLVNGTWNVDQPGTRIVVASQTVGTENRVMKLYRE